MAHVIIPDAGTWKYASLPRYDTPAIMSYSARWSNVQHESCTVLLLLSMHNTGRMIHAHVAYSFISIYKIRCSSAFRARLCQSNTATRETSTRDQENTPSAHALSRRRPRTRCLARRTQLVAPSCSLPMPTNAPAASIGSSTNFLRRALSEWAFCQQSN